MGCNFLVLFILYLQTRRDELARTQLASAFALVHMMFILAGKLLWQGDSGSQLDVWKMLWSVSHAKVHAEEAAVADECEVHGLCAVCLDNLCTSIGSIAQTSIGIGSQRGLALSGCRQSHTVRSGAGLSAA